MEQSLCVLQSKTARDKRRKAKRNYIYFFKMSSVIVTVLMIVVVACGEESPEVVVEPVQSVQVDNGLANTDLLAAFVIFRHGDRTPDLDELELYPTEEKYSDVFFPYGLKALTNKGKQRSYRIGEYLRSRYNGFISKLYLPDEIVVRTTDFARTKMTALTALAALYPPPPAQKWNPDLDWQPVPYDTLPYDEDDLLYYYNCPRYITLRDQTYETPQIRSDMKPYQGLYKYLSQKTGTNITKPEDIFYLDNLFQTLENVGVKPPKWAQDIMPKIKEVTKIEYHAEFFSPELIKLASGVLLSEIVNATLDAIHGTIEPKLYLYSAHENNVAALMAAVNVFYPHQPAYGATFSVELRRRRLTGQFGITAVYSPVAGGPGKVLPIKDCGGLPLCDYETFLNLTREFVATYDEFKEQCYKPVKGIRN